MRSPVQIYEFIEDILNKRGISDRQMLTEAGLKRGVLDNMKKGSMPAADKIAAIAKYLGVSVDSLLGTEQDVKSIASDIKKRFMQTTREVELYNALVLMSDEDLKKVESYAAFLVAEKEKEPPASSGE